MDHTYKPVDFREGTNYGAQTGVNYGSIVNHFSSQNDSDPIGNVDWTIPRSTNPLFTGRADILQDVEQAIRPAVSSSDGVACQTRCCIVITGLGGQGKSEICLQVVDRVRDLFWGVFWVDVSTALLAENHFLDIASRLGRPAKTVEEARHELASTKHPWLLVLDNADDPKVGYQQYVPSGQNGVVLLTSRNAGCQVYGTTMAVDLEGLAEDDAVTLLLSAARVNASDQGRWEADARKVAALTILSP